MHLDFQLIVVTMITLILSIAVHEFGHAFVADRLGDRLPRMQGRVTLNPAAHADPYGTLLFPALFLLLSGGHSLGFGWGKPVQVQPTAFTRKLRMRTAHMFVAAAGPAMNLTFGIVVSFVLLVTMRLGWVGGEVANALYQAVLINFVLMFFNFIPFPPLDGGTIVEGLLPTRYLPTFEKIGRFGPFIFFAIILLPGVSNVFVWPAYKLFQFWMGILGLA